MRLVNDLFVHTSLKKMSKVRAVLAHLALICMNFKKTFLQLTQKIYVKHKSAIITMEVMQCNQLWKFLPNSHKRLTDNMDTQVCECDNSRTK